MALVVSESPAPRQRRPLPVRAWRLLCRLTLRYRIWETEAWVRDCEKDGLDVSLSRPDIVADLAAMRVRLALLQPSSPQQDADRAPAPAECSTEIGADMPGRKVTREERIARRIEGAVVLGLAVLLLTHFAAVLFAA
jgi:hypothetical protein